MPRSPRKYSEFGYYHIIIRGNNKRHLFRREEDVRYWLSALESYLLRFSIRIHHYCLMTNHVHQLLWSEDLKTLSRFMHGVLRTYHHYYRKKYSLFGHLYQGRFRSFPIDDPAYFLECGRYIEKNPVRAGMVSQAEDWPFSSYRFYAYGESHPFIVPSKEYLGLAEDPKGRQKIYQKYIEVTRPYEHLIHKHLRD